MNLRRCLFVLPVVTLISLGAWKAFALDDEKPAASPLKTESKEKPATEKPYVPKSKRELQKQLTRIQYDVTQNEETEPAFRNLYWNNKRDGIYKCVVCDRDLFSSATKYKSGTGWPSFFAPLKGKNVATRTDYRLFYARTEVHCSQCKAHLGHVFNDGPKPTGLRYCMNSASLRFVEKKDEGEATEK